MEGLKATGGAVAGRIAGKMLGSRANLTPAVQGGIVFVAGVMLARSVDRSLGLGMAAAGGELAAATFLPNIAGIGDLDPADIDAIERAAMRGVEDVVTGGDDVVTGGYDVVTGDDDTMTGDDDDM